MSRSGYSDDLCPLDLGRWRGQVASAIRGKRGQQLLKDLVAALDTMPDKRLIPHALESGGEYCALGAVAKKRNLKVAEIDSTDPYEAAEALNICHQLAQEVVYVNDEQGMMNETPEQRFERVRKWAISNLSLAPDVLEER